MNTPTAQIDSKFLLLVPAKTQTFIVRVVSKGQTYGRNFCCTHDKDMPLVEFYATKTHWGEACPFGHFVSRYYLDTILEGTRGCGLSLYGDEAELFVDANAMDYVKGQLGYNVSRPCKGFDVVAE